MKSVTTLSVAEQCHPERSAAESKDPVAISSVVPRDLIRSLPVRSACGLPVHVAASPAAPFSTELVLSEAEGLGMTR